MMEQVAHDRGLHIQVSQPSVSAVQILVAGQPDPAG